MGYQPPFINLEELKSKLPGRINYYTVRLIVCYNGKLEIRFTRKDKYMVIITCVKKEK